MGDGKCRYNEGGIVKGGVAMFGNDRGMETVIPLPPPFSGFSPPPGPMLRCYQEGMRERIKISKAELASGKWKGLESLS